MADVRQFLFQDEYDDAPDVAVKPARLTLDPSRWSYDDYFQFVKAFSRARWDEALPLIMQITVDWSFDIPIAPDAWLDLPFDELPEIVKSVNSTLSAFIDGLDTAEVTVNLRAWKMRDFLNFQKASKESDVETLERLLRKCCRIAGENVLPEHLTFKQGALMARAFGATTKELFSAGK